MKKKIRKLIKRFEYKEKYKEVLKQLKQEQIKNAELLKEIDRLEFLLDKDTKAKKIENQELLLENYRLKVHELRKEIINLKGEDK